MAYQELSQKGNNYTTICVWKGRLLRGYHYNDICGFFQDPEKVPHQLDMNYERLQSDLVHMDKKDKEYKVIKMLTISR